MLAMLNLWTDYFKADNFEVAYQAVRRYIGREKFAPTIADIRSIMDELTATDGQIVEQRMFDNWMDDVPQIAG